MRKEFSRWIERRGREQENLIFITGDLGFGALENVKSQLGHRFVNAGVAEQNMISMAAAMAQQGLTPFCYSIAPFAVFRPAEQIRVDLCLHGLNVKIVGNGGGYGYGIMGSTHHAIEDLGFLSSLSKMRCYIPFANESVESTCEEMMNYNGPSYLRLGFGNISGEAVPMIQYSSTHKLMSGSELTFVTIGPIATNACQAIQKSGVRADLFVINEFPTYEDAEILESVARTKTLLIAEEHVARGGIGEHLSLKMIHAQVYPHRFIHRFALGYPEGLYGSQNYHQQQCRLDPASLSQDLLELRR